MDKEPRDIRALIDNASPAKPAKPTAKPGGREGRTGASKGGKVTDVQAETALRLDFERKIQNADDFGVLVDKLAPKIHKANLRKISKEALFKLLAKKAGVSLEALRESLPARPDGGAGGLSKDRESGDFLPYECVNNQLFVYLDEGKRPLCNFSAWIEEEILFDGGGGEVETLFRLEGVLRDGSPLPLVELPASRFHGMSWVSSEWGARAVVHAGNSIKDHLRVAIQALTPCERRRTVYGHAGWRKLGDEWLFLHGGGAVGATGCREDVEVKAGEGNMKRYAFDTTGGGDPCADIRASLRLLDISSHNPALGVVLLASVYRAPLGEAAPIDHGIFLAGQTGSRKSEAAGIALAHFGRGLNSRNFPANWDDTETDIEAKGHAAKDCLFVVDDFKPRGASSDVHKLHVKADRLFRGVGNQSGRGRRTADMKQRAAHYPRGLVLATGEDIPRGASLRARLALVELSMVDVDNGILSELQAYAREGGLERSMVGYLRWLAGDFDTFKAGLPNYLRGLRDNAIQEGFALAHPRAADIYASLLTGIHTFVDYAQASGAIEPEQAIKTFLHCEAALKAMIAAQGDLQADQDEVLQFLGFLKSALNAGSCHFGDYLTQGAPAEHKSFWGWRVVPIPGAPEDAPAAQKPLGELVGWVDQVRVYLDGNAAFAAAQEMAKATGENLAITQRTLWARLYERGLLLDVQKESGKLRLSPKRVVAGVSRRVYVMSRKTLEDGL